MTIDRERTYQLLKDFDIETLFIDELGWDFHTQSFSIQVDGAEYLLAATAQKRGMGVYVCTNANDGSIPARATRQKIERQVAQRVHEHLIIFIDDAKTTQIWQWVKREEGERPQYQDQHYHTSQHGEALIQKLAAIAFSLDEERDIGIVDVASRVRDAFDVDGVTKRFYDQFKKEHDAFLQFLDGIPDEAMQRWYVSVILNRLMFIYFIQKKGFLDGDPYYLRTNLQLSQETAQDKYYSAFLCPLFFEGFAKPKNERSQEMSSLIGDVPYLNGGIFQKHQIEEHHGESIQIPDAAFERLFKFFEDYQWHLDDRLDRSDNEINPEVLGYIFEKYINQKQMGAYYTKEDITEYISKNTIIPFLLESVQKKCKKAFEPPVGVLDRVVTAAIERPLLARESSTCDTSASVWQLLVDRPDRYIYASIKKGVKKPLPASIAHGVGDDSQRDEWNRSGLPDYALPTEIWREVVARRERYEEVRTKLTNGDIHDVNDLITYNLHIRRFTHDIIQNCRSPKLLNAFWNAIKEVTVLDPTCGSGAFLFAALNILEPLYEACLDRMQVFLDEWQTADLNPHPNFCSQFQETLHRVGEHANRKYFILKSIIIKNLYGVDIMAEAIEICKLRLFLKMVAQVDNVNRIEPLPDIDFNVQTGNTLVGYATFEEAEKAITDTFDFDNTMRRIRESAEDIDALFGQFRLQQLVFRGDVTTTAKQELQGRLHELEDELNRYLAGQYHVDPDNEEAYQEWLISHKPFHWFVEYFGILNKRESDVLKKGGFDVIIGNPPYVEYNKVKEEYTIRGYDTENCGNLYAFVMERLMDLGKKNGRCGMIVPLSGHSTDRMKPLAKNYYSKVACLHLVNISGDAHPSVLFSGVKFRLAIFLALTQSQNPGLYTSRYSKWYSDEREGLFQLLEYVPVKRDSQSFFPKLSTRVHRSIIDKLKQQRGSLGLNSGNHKIYYHNAPVHWIRAHSFVPYFHSERDGQRISTQLKPMTFENADSALAAAGVLCSSLFYIWWITTSDCYHLNKREVDGFPLDLGNADFTQEIASISERLMEDMIAKSRRRVYVYRTSGRVEYDEFYLKESKPIIDNIDRVLAKHYGFTHEELDFIINYDIKYRMGLGSD